jgi:hypothetical protein
VPGLCGLWTPAWARSGRAAGRDRDDGAGHRSAAVRGRDDGAGHGAASRPSGTRRVDGGRRHSGPAGEGHDCRKKKTNLNRSELCRT